MLFSLSAGAVEVFLNGVQITGAKDQVIDKAPLWCSVDLRDGLGLNLEGGAWILARLSGTEPKLRIYAEGRSQEELRHLMHVARRLFTQRRL